MNLTSVKTIKNLCEKYGIQPSKRLGQSFLINKNILDKIIQEGELSNKDMVLEIGPGFGVLTARLLEKVRKVVAIEKDKRLFEFLNKEIKNKELKIINDDVLKIRIKEYRLRNMEYKIISNLPYQITSPVLWKFLHNVETPRWDVSKPELMVLMIQKEVAERIVSKPGKMSILSVMCQFYADCEIVTNVSRGNFWPEPEVDSAIVKFRIKNSESRIKEEKRLFQIVKIGFSAKRKMLKNNLSNGLKIPQESVKNALKKAGLNEKIRAQELSVEDWIKLFHVL